MKKLILTLMMLIPSTVFAQSFEGFRPYTGNKPQKVSVSLPLFPLIGTPNVFSFSSISTYVDIVQSFQMDPEGTDDEVLRSIIDTINQFYGKDSSLYLLALPSFKVEVNTRYFEWRMRGGVLSSNYVNLHGPVNKLNPNDIHHDPNNKPYINTTPQTLLELNSSSYFGTDAWAIGKVPFKLRSYELTLLFGVGGAIAYNVSYGMNVNIGDKLSVDENITTNNTEHHALLWNIGLMTGLEFNGWQYLQPRLVLQVRDIYDGYSKRSMPKVDIGAEVKVWKIITIRSDVVDCANPMVRVEGSRTFLGNNEVAVGGVFRSPWPDRNFGYAMLGLGGKLLKWTIMTTFTKQTFGVFTGLNIGWNP